MGIFKENESGKFLFLPKKGEEITVTIVGEVTRVKSDNEDFNYKKKGNIDAGYYDTIAVVNEATGEEETLLIGTWVFYFLLKEQEDLDIGNTITISHAGTREYKITKK